MTTNWKLGLGLSLVTAIMWGLLPLALKSILDVMDPVTISWYRFSVSAAIALLWYGHRRGQALKNLLFSAHWPLSMAVVVGLVGNYLLYIWGLGVASLGIGLLLFFHHRLNSNIPTSDTYVAGVAMIVAAALVWSVYGLAQKQLLIAHHAKDILLLICLSGTIILWPLSWQALRSQRSRNPKERNSIPG